MRPYFFSFLLALSQVSKLYTGMARAGTGLKGLQDTQGTPLLSSRLIATNEQGAVRHGNSRGPQLEQPVSGAFRRHTGRQPFVRRETRQCVSREGGAREGEPWEVP